MKLTIEIDDDEIRRVLAPWLQLTPAAEPHAPVKLLTVREVADQLGVGRSKAYRLVTSRQIESISIGRTKRISPAALAAFIAAPSEVKSLRLRPFAPQSNPPQLPRRQLRPVAREQRPRRQSKETRAIDLSARPAASHRPRLTDEQWTKIAEEMIEEGWPTDVVGQMEYDRRNGSQRRYVLTINEAAQYLGLSRYGVKKLIASGRLRLFNTAPANRGDKPSQRIPAKDVLLL